MPGDDCGTARRTRRGWRLLGIYLLLAAGTTATFCGVVQNDFINLDDGDLIYDNYRVSRGLTREGLRHALTGVHAANWQPLTTLSHMLDCELFGANRPGLHHLVSLGLHVGSVLLLFEALRRMTGEVWPSVLVAALFAVHPLRVESVAWAAERKDVLSGLFFMLTLLTYAGYARSPGLGRYVLLIVVFCLGLLSKAMLVTVPCVLLLLDWWPLRRWRPKRFAATEEPDVIQFPERQGCWLIAEKLPLLAAAALLAAVTVRSQTVAISSLSALPVSWRLTNATLAYVFYVWKTIWPTQLAIVYSHPGLALHADLGPWLYPTLGAFLLLAVITGCAVYQARRRPYFVVGWLWYLGTLVPVIGLIQVGFASYADRYTYLPMIGVYLAFAWGARDLVRRWPATRYTLVACTAIWLVSLMVVTWHQVGYWRDSRTLYERTLQVTSDNPLIRCCLGGALLAGGEYDAARRQYEEAVRLMPDYAQAHSGLGWALEELGQSAAAEEHLRASLRLQPELWQAHVVLADTLVSLKRGDEALNHAEEALRLEPHSPAAHNSVGYVLGTRGQTGQAVEHFQQALRLDPEFAEAHNNWGLLVEKLGRQDEAIAHFQEAARIKPSYAEAHVNCANALQRLGRADEALKHAEEAVRLRPQMAAAQNILGYVLGSRGQSRQAVKHFEEALRLDPDFAEAHNNWGLVLNKLGQRDEATVHFREATRLKPNFAECHLNWGHALQGLGRWDEAVAQFAQALRINPNLAEAHYNWGNTLQVMQRLDEAGAHYEAALLLKPDLAEAHVNWGNTLKKQGRLEEAVIHFQEAARIKPDLAETQYNWGLALHDLGRLDEAVVHYQEAVRLQPDYAEAHNNWGTALAAKGRMEAAAEHFRKALQLRPEFTAAGDNLRRAEAQLPQPSGRAAP